MSRIGNKTITLPADVTVSQEGAVVTVKGPKGELSREIVSAITMNVEGTEVSFTRESDDNKTKALHGTTRANVANMVEGVSEGFTKTLKLVVLVTVLQIVFEDREALTVEVPDALTIKISGISKQKVGDLAAEIRAVRSPEPYKVKVFVTKVKLFVVRKVRLVNKNKLRVKRHKRVRGKISGTAARPRLNVFRSNANIYAQLIDDVAGVTLASASSHDAEVTGSKTEQAVKVGELIAARGKAAKVEEVVFDRGGYVYHGRVQALAESARENENVVAINRVTKVVKGGRRLRFAALVVVGDKQGHVGFGTGKAQEVPEAIRKAIEDAKRKLITVPTVATTIPHEVLGEWGGGKILVKPAEEGSGVAAGGAARSVMELAGIADVTAKSLGSSTPVNVIRATFDALTSLKDAEEVAKLRGVSLEHLAE
ncbi:hypothetical protein Pfo_031134 [Paulownia fortunei]|nr:hypothetical protein Pfo_031134 [Paulownia fortunei]